MRVDFYVLGEVPAERIVAALAAKALEGGDRLLVVEGDSGKRTALSRALWEAKPEAFLANGLADEPHSARQPILLSDRPDPLNGAQLLCLADGLWREAEGFERVFYLFDDSALEEAREQWKRLGSSADVERRFWKQTDGRWVEGP